MTDEERRRIDNEVSALIKEARPRVRSRLLPILAETRAGYRYLLKEAVGEEFDWLARELFGLSLSTKTYVKALHRAVRELFGEFLTDLTTVDEDLNIALCLNLDSLCDHWESEAWRRDRTREPTEDGGSPQSDKSHAEEAVERSSEVPADKPQQEQPTAKPAPSKRMKPSEAEVLDLLKSEKVTFEIAARALSCTKRNVYDLAARNVLETVGEGTNRKILRESILRRLGIKPRSE